MPKLLLARQYNVDSDMISTVMHGTMLSSFVKLAMTICNMQVACMICADNTQNVSYVVNLCL